MNLRRTGKTRQQIEQLKGLLEDGKKVLCYGLLEPSRYLDQLGEEYLAEKVLSDENNLIGHRIWKVK
mgnify:CR=1 FL=1